MHFDGNTVIAAGVFAHLLLALGRQVFAKPQDRAKMDALAAKADAILSEIQAVAALLPTTPPVGSQTGSQANSQKGQ